MWEYVVRYCFFFTVLCSFVIRITEHTIVVRDVSIVSAPPNYFGIEGRIE